MCLQNGSFTLGSSVLYYGTGGSNVSLIEEPIYCITGNAMLWRWALRDVALIGIGFYRKRLEEETNPAIRALRELLAVYYERDVSYEVYDRVDGERYVNG